MLLKSKHRSGATILFFEIGAANEIYVSGLKKLFIALLLPDLLQTVYHRERLVNYVFYCVINAVDIVKTVMAAK